ncbi:MAG TPA: hypothetical protein VJ576_17625 [Rhodocyclaceae bacterium]|nr:hypothetical protein [Rhodocyclaceae bacterium]
MTLDQEAVDRASRRLAGLAALRRLRRLVDEENALEFWRARWAFRLGTLFAVVGAALLAYLLIRLL